MEISWSEYKAQASADLDEYGAYIYRGQRIAAWRLTSAIHRTALVRSTADITGYVNYMLPKVHDAVEGWTGRTWDLATPLGLAEFLAFLQHNGFPTPLLDWTASPYVAAYFAFEGVNHFAPQAENVAIYSFNQSAWQTDFKQFYDVANQTPHVSVLKPRMIGNHKLAMQNGCFTWSNVSDVEEHIRLNETGTKVYLRKYELQVTERPRVMRELDLMGISAIQLMPSVEAVCKKALEDLIGIHPLEPTSDL
jgi:hypothetical protein